MEFSRQEYWSGLPLPSPGDLPHPGIEPGFLAGFLALQEILHHLSYQRTPPLPPPPKKKWRFISLPFEVGQAAILPKGREQNYHCHCVKPPWGMGREGWSLGANLSVTLDNHFKNQIYIGYS